MESNRDIKISFLITHYNRPDSLKKCVDSIREFSEFNYEIVVSDDGSSDENIKKLNELGIDKIVLDAKNSGLGVNINKGLKKCEGQYIFYIQEDFVFINSNTKILVEAIKIMESDNIDIIRFYTPYKFFKIKRLNDFFYEIPSWTFKNFFFNQFRYSDWPHIKKRHFHDNFGYYVENMFVLYTENEFMVRMMSLNPKIAASFTNVCNPQPAKSVRENTGADRNRNLILNVLRSLRFTFEMIVYNKNKRKLTTFKFQYKDGKF